MRKEVKMPALSDTMEAGRLVHWLKHPGDTVEQGESLAEVETDKAVMDLEAFASGYLAGPLAEEDQEYPVGETLAWITDEESEQKESRQAQKTKEPEKQAKKSDTREKEEKAEKQQPDTKKRPEIAATKKVWSEMGKSQPEKEGQEDIKRGESPVLDQALVGRSGRTRESSQTGVYPKQVQTVLKRELDAGPAYEIKSQFPLRKIIATTMMHAVYTPQFRVSTQVDLTSLKEYAEEHNRSLSLLLAKACAQAILKQPVFNAAWTPDGLAHRERIDVAIAMETEKGLLTPVLRDVAGRTMEDLARDWNELKDKVEHHRAKPEEYRGATFYMSNMGMYPKVIQFDAVIPPGASAILAVAAPGEQGSILTLSCDHRVVFGADAARFLTNLSEILQEPESWTE